MRLVGRLSRETLGSTFRDSAPLLANVMKAWEGLYARGEQALLDEIKALTDAPVGSMPGAFETIVAPLIEEVRRSYHGR